MQRKRLVGAELFQIQIYTRKSKKLFFIKHNLKKKRRTKLWKITASVASASIAILPNAVAISGIVNGTVLMKIPTKFGTVSTLLPDARMYILLSIESVSCYGLCNESTYGTLNQKQKPRQKPWFLFLGLSGCSDSNVR